MLKPGAATSTQSPQELKSTSFAAQSVAATVSTSGYAAGYCGALPPVLPAATTRSEPLLVA
ncbi:hypothetical protein GCM10020218_098850 [Dactylosporangium vinaceum]